MTDLAMARRRLPLLDAAIEKQRANADYYSRELGAGSPKLCHETQDAFFNRYLYPIVFDSVDQRDRAADYLRRRSIGTSKPYGDIARIASLHYGYEGDCPTAERVASRILVVPSHHGLGRHDLRRVVECLNGSWSQASQGGKSVWTN
jgi:perosamine synthetase